MKILHKIIAGFALLLLLLLAIVAVNFNNTRIVTDRLFTITEESAPLSQAASDLYVHLLRANEVLLSALASKQSDDVKAREPKFAENIGKFSALLSDIPRYVNGRQGLLDNIQSTQRLVSDYTKQAKKLIALHEQLLDAEVRAERLQHYSRSQELSLSNHLQAYQAEHAGLPTGTIVEGLLRETGNAYKALTRFDSDHDITQLEKSLASQDSVIGERLAALSQSDPRGGRIAAVMVQHLLNDLSAPDGLLAAFRQSFALSNQLKAQQQSTDASLQAVLGSINDFSGQALAVAKQAKGDTDAALQQGYWISLFTGAIAIVLTLLVAAWVAHTLRVPLSQFREVLIKVTRGDLRARFARGQQDEFGELGGYLNELTATLQSTVREQLEAAERLAGTSRDNERISD
ncbi:MAG: HAMP domain-containing protein, partial [Aeromonas sp.]